MRTPKHLTWIAVALLGLAAGPTRARAQGYVYYTYPQRPAYVAAPQAAYYDYAPARAPIYRGYAPGPGVRYAAPSRLYHDYSTGHDILRDRTNPHWTFDYNDWAAHNF